MKAKWRQRRRTSPEQSRVGALAKFEKLKIKVKVCSHVGLVVSTVAVASGLLLLQCDYFIICLARF